MHVIALVLVEIPEDEPRKKKVKFVTANNDLRVFSRKIHRDLENEKPNEHGSKRYMLCLGLSIKQHEYDA